MKYNGIPTPCEAISYGEVEDYTVNIVAGAADTTAPAAPSSLAGTTTSTTNLSCASSDNVAVTGYNVYQGSTLKATVASTSYVVTGLTANNAYILCKSKDAAGNISATSNAISVTTLNNTGILYF
jgi:hypothetical protein